MQEMHLRQSKVVISKKCITIRPTSFDPCETSGGSAPIEKIETTEEFTSSKFIKREEVKSDRPELGTARSSSFWWKRNAKWREF